MPSSTFFNLPEEKRQKFLLAAQAEFARAPYADASINKIVQGADIARGSFYAYFKDKGELFGYLLQGCVEVLADQLGEMLDRRAGDPFAALLDFYDSVQHDFRDPARADQYRQIIAMFKLNAGAPDGMVNMGAASGALFPLREKLDPRLLDIRQESDLEDVFGLLMVLTLKTVMEGMFSPDPAATRTHLEHTFDLLRRGMGRKTGGEETDTL